MGALRIISATRHDLETFKESAELARSLQGLFSPEPIQVDISCRNVLGLPAVYNKSIRKCGDDDMLVFVHDDVRIDDFYLVHRLTDALSAFDVIGVAGNSLLTPGHVGWSLQRASDDLLKWSDPQYLSGAIGTRRGDQRRLTVYGSPPRPCALLDGCFLATTARTLRTHGIFFDERFLFHFYDLDFCRTCAAHGLRLGTWPIALSHASGGGFGTPPWTAALRVYEQKWPPNSR